ncbi:alpha-crystallin B chain-like [Dicentrarchus labrax]|uniref:Alpha-crystallin B chain n=1 Tax=Dicentrarchus labrax TaxID=13489 RepID=A0A8C4EDD2_DICLA|nr:alpha-crystallin B chain-like [Dicentrarchus labrax]
MGGKRPINAVQESTSDQVKPPSHPSFLHLVWNLIMDIPIQYPWYRRAFPHRLSDLSLAEPLTDWPLIWPLPWSFPWMRPSFMRWFNWSDNGPSEMRIEKDRYVIYLDVKHFSPDELSVSVSDEFITVHAKHEDRKDDHGFVSREFLRKYRLPNGILSADVTSSLSSDGVLTITAPRSSAVGEERIIPIACEDGTPKQKM